MRDSRLLVVMLAALALAGCLRRDPPIQYQYVYPPPPGHVTQAPAYPAQAQAYPAAPVYQAQAQAVPPPASAPAARGLFAQGGPLTQIYQRPAYHQSPCGPYGCAPPSYQPPVTQAPAYSVSGYPAYAAYPPQAGVVQGYALDAGDRLRITVFGQQGLTNSYAVDAAGNITMPLIGAVPARGLTTEQLSRSISERLRQGSIREPRVAIEIEAHRPFFIHGEVGNPGQYLYVANMTVQNAVAIAGGFGPRADMSKLTLTRSMGGQTTNAAVGLNHPVRPGDTLRIGKKWF